MKKKQYFIILKMIDREFMLFKLVADKTKKNFNYKIILVKQYKY